MSDTVFKLIPADPQYVPPTDAQERAVALLEQITPGGGECESHVYDRLTYIDAGENVSTVYCPACGAAIPLDWSAEHKEHFVWYLDLFDQAVKHGAEVVRARMPCCREVVPFASLTFDWPGGFTVFELSVSDPWIERPVTQEALSQLGTALGCELRQIWARY